VIDRDARAVGASIRNFGFITVTGQQRGITWNRARRSRDVWQDVAARAGIPVLQRGLLVCARRPEAMAVLEEFASGPMGAGCRLRAAAGLPAPFRPDLLGALQSPHELRVESRDAIPRLAAWLETQGVRFLRTTAVHAVESGRVHTPAGVFAAPMIVVCPGPDLTTLFPDVIARRGITLCKLHMLRVAPIGALLHAPVMSDLGLVRYLGYAEAPSLPALRQRLEREQAAWLADGIHLIAVQGGDGSLVVGDSHHYAATPDPFQPRAVDDRILAELSAVLAIAAPEVVERWVGVYPSGPDTAFTEAPMPGVRLSMVTSGTGASTGFAIAEETLAEMVREPPPPHAAGQHA
jgi:FAD dependent oxidoreductase TIGR03364